MIKRYQYLGQGGQILWTDWFSWGNEEYCPKYQLERHPKLLNEYKN